VRTGSIRRCGPDEQLRVAVEGLVKRAEDRWAGAGGQFVESDPFDELSSRVHHVTQTRSASTSLREASSLFVAITPA
jgi:hypothetical protein